MDTYRRLIVVLALLAAVGLAACVPVSSVEKKGGDGEFRVLLTAEPVSLNPDIRNDDPAFNVAQGLFNKLVTLDADYRIIPDLATSWTIADDGRTYTFQLARGVQWHDGQPFTAADVKWTLETIAREKTPAQATAAQITGIETPDPHKVIVRLKEPWAPFLPNLAWYGTLILPKHLYDGTYWAKNPANEKPIGTGPFKFVEWVKGDHITLAANPAYFRRGPFVDRVTYLIRKDASAVSAEMLKRGDIDFTLARPPYGDLRALQTTAGIKVVTFAHPARYYLGFNLQRRPYDDLRVRRAINMAINRVTLVEQGLQGYGAVGIGFYTPAIAWAYNARAQAPAFDLTAANALLDQAGLARDAAGIRLKPTLIISNLSPYTELAATLREQLRAIGLDVQIVALPTTEWTKRANQERDFDLGITDGTQGPDPDNLSLRFGAGGSNNFMGFANPAFDAALAEGARRTKLEERSQSYYGSRIK
jgi:peptide/nickel transport system substrate-binding protein